MSILINIASEFTGKKAFQQAEKATKNLDFSVKKLGKSLGVALSVSAVVAFGKAAAKAFMEDEKSAALLANTVDNLGLSFANPAINNFIESLSRAAGVSDDLLRPAMQKLLTTTGSVINSQKMLEEAISISRGSGVDLATVVNDLSQAYVGNLKGLKKYNLGLTQAELAAMDFQQIQAKLNKTFAGSNAKYLETYAGKMDLLTTAAGEAQETIGKGLVDALMEITGNTEIQGLISDIDEFAQGLADTLVEVGKLLKPVVDSLRALIGLVKQGGKVDVLDPTKTFKEGMNKRRKPLYGPESVINAYRNSAEQRAAAEASKKAESAAAKRAKDLANMLKKNTTELKRQATAKKQNSLFDLDIIQRMAALQGKITEEERTRLELQLALLTGNEAKAAKLAGELADSIDKTGKLKIWLTTLPDANNPFKGWDEWLKNFKSELATLNNGVVSRSPNGNVPQMPIASPDAVLAQASADFANANNQIKIIVEGGDEVTSLMRFKIQEAAQSGSTVNWSQSVGAYDR